MKRIFILLYGASSHVMFLGTYLYFIAFLGGFVVPKIVNTGAVTSLPATLIINFLLISIFATQRGLAINPIQ